MPDSIKRMTIGDRQATVIYLKNGFEPATADDHTMVKIVYDDGDIEFATLAGPEDDEEDSDEEDNDEEGPDHEIEIELEDEPEPAEDRRITRPQR